MAPGEGETGKEQDNSQGAGEGGSENKDEGSKGENTNVDTGAEDKGAGEGGDKYQGEQGAGDQAAWLSELPEGLRGEKSLHEVKDFASLAKGYVEAQKFIGGSIRVPGANASDEEVKAFRTKLGVPEVAAGYEFARPDMPEHVQFQDADKTRFAEFSHSVGLTPHQAQGVLNYYGGLVTDQARHAQATSAAAMEELQEEWGEATGRKVATAHAAVASLASEEVNTMLEASGVGNHPAVVRLFAKVGELLQEDGVLAEVTHAGMTKEDAQSELEKLMADPAYADESKPDHHKVVDRVTRLHETIYN